MSDVTCVLRAGAVNGERPGWLPSEGRLYFVDMRSPALHAFEPANGRHLWWDMPDWVGTYAFGADGRMVLALRTGLFAFEPRDGSLAALAPPPYDPRRFCFNDGRCDRQGRFHVGPLFFPLGPRETQAEGPNKAPVWRYDGTGGWRAVTRPVEIANGLAWSPDGRTMYHADTARKTIWTSDYDPDTGATENRRVFAQVDAGGPTGGPDGAAVDAEGFYWSAVFGDGSLLRFDPDGEVERRVPLPVRYPTMPAFGGPDLKTLYVTSASFPIPADERAARPEAGGLFAFEAPAPGLPPDLFQPIP